MGRATQGVRLIRLDETDEIGDVAVVKREEDEEVVLPDVTEMPEAVDDSEE